MTTFSTSLKLELPADGSQTGTWGQTTNKNIGTLLEQAITGVQSITMLDANYTLTNLNGVSDEARNAIIVAQGTNSAVRDIIAPLVNKIYYVWNSTTGGYSVRIRGASGTSVTVPNGMIVPVFCDGVNFYTLLNSASGNFTVAGNAEVVGNLQIDGSLSGTTAAFSGAITSVNPAFSGTPTAPTAAAGTSTTQIATTAFVTGSVGALGTMASQNANAVSITGGSINSLTVTSFGTNSYGTRTVSASGPSGGANGDIWYQV